MVRLPGYLADMLDLGLAESRDERLPQPIMPEQLRRIKEHLDREWAELYGTEPNPYHLGRK